MSVIIVMVMLIFVVIGVAVYFLFFSGKTEAKGTNVDCEVGDWGTCTEAGNQSRYVTKYPKGDGEECPVLVQACTPKKIDCEMGSWSECSPTTKKRTREVKTVKSGGGADCIDKTLVEDCIPNVDCKLSEWSACEASPTSQTYQSIRTVTTEQSGTGAACPTGLSKDCAIIKDYEFIPQYDYPGNDIVYGTKTKDECVDLCNKYKDCVAFNYRSSDGNCNIKSKAENGVIKRDYDSWVVKVPRKQGLLQQLYKKQLLPLPVYISKTLITKNVSN